jgi:hypothetical protein
MLGARDYSLDSVKARGDRVVIAYSWSSKEGRRHRWAQTLRLKHGKIIESKAFATPRSAAALMRLRTAFA